jgi:hypothetical protein
MPEHFHLLISEPERGNPSAVMKVLKQRFARRVRKRGNGAQFSLWPNADEEHVWQKRFYDFNVYSERKRIEKLRYMHRNPVKRGLADSPDQWRWSSFRFYMFGEVGLVRVNETGVMKMGASCDLSRRCTRGSPADGRSVTETTMGAVEVVMLQPRGERLVAFVRVEVMANVGPLAQGGLNEAFGLAVGARSVGTGEAVLDAELEAGGAEVARAIGGWPGAEISKPRVPHSSRSMRGVGDVNLHLDPWPTNSHRRTTTDAPTHLSP